MSREILYEGKYRRMICKDGWEYVERVRGGGIVVMIPVTDDGKLVLVEQWRVPLQKFVIEFPAGLANDLDSNQHESLEETARRELIEETGYSARDMIFFGEGPSSSSTTSDVLTVYFATGLKKVGVGGGDETENITVHVVPLDAVEDWLKDKELAGKMIDLRIYSGLYSLQKTRRLK